MTKRFNVDLLSYNTHFYHKSFEPHGDTGGCTWYCYSILHGVAQQLSWIYSHLMVFHPHFSLILRAFYLTGLLLSQLKATIRIFIPPVSVFIMTQYLFLPLLNRILSCIDNSNFRIYEPTTNNLTRSHGLFTILHPRSYKSFQSEVTKALCHLCFKDSWVLFFSETFFQHSQDFEWVNIDC